MDQQKNVSLSIMRSFSKAGSVRRMGRIPEISLVKSTLLTLALQQQYSGERGVTEIPVCSMYVLHKNCTTRADDVHHTYRFACLQSGLLSTVFMEEPIGRSRR